ncbi:MAG: DNA alkylation repair protein [Bacteroidales bacterium]|nr:DNA alkylation repair protein [Bacteroidales bacterium]
MQKNSQDKQGMKEYTKRVCTFLEKHRNQEVAQAMSGNKGLKFLGLKNTEQIDLFKTIFSQLHLPNIKDTNNVVREFFAMEEREYLYFGIRLFEKRKKYWKKTDIVFIESLILTQPAWDSMKDISAVLVAPFVKKFPKVGLEFINSWGHSKNPWLNASAIMFQRQLKENTNVELLEKLILDNISSQNEITNHAIGSALRDYSRTNPQWVINFLTNNSLKLSRIAKQEGIKWIEKKGIIL